MEKGVSNKLFFSIEGKRGRLQRSSCQWGIFSHLQSLRGLGDRESQDFVVQRPHFQRQFNVRTSVSTDLRLLHPLEMDFAKSSFLRLILA